MTSADERAVLAVAVESGGLRLVSSERFSGEAGPRGVVTGHRVTVGDASGALAERVLYLETTPPRADRPGVLRLVDDLGDERAVWAYPHDPGLPGLALAATPSGSGRLLGHSEPASAVEVIAYRPGKRAVIRVRGGAAATAYLKVVPPGAESSIAARHRAWRTAGIPVPEVLGEHADGVLALAGHPGVTADLVVERLHGDAERHALLDDLDRLRARIALVASTASARHSLADRADWYLARVGTADAELVPRLARLGEQVAALGDAGARSRPVTVHGDLHLAQVFVDPARPTAITGVIDIDTAGSGDPADDTAALWAHLAASAARSAARGERDRAAASLRFAAAARRRWPAPGQGGTERIVAVAAIHLLGHALTGAITPATAVGGAESLLRRFTRAVS